MWESRDDTPYDIAFDQSGALIVGTGNKGKLYRLEGEPLRADAARARQRPTGHRGLPDRAGRVYYATANPGKLFRLSSERAPRGTYESEARDAQMVATWGAISWHGTTPAGTKVERLHACGQHRNARRYLECLVLRLRQPGRVTHHQPEGALPAVARRC